MGWGAKGNTLGPKGDKGDAGGVSQAGITEAGLMQSQGAAANKYGTNGMPIISDNRRLLGGIYEDGTVEFLKFKAVDNDYSNAEAATVSRRTTVSAPGDSLTRGFNGGVDWPLADAWPAKLALLDVGATVNNLGYSGNTIDEVGIRVGAIVLNLSVTGGSIPTTGAVTVTSTQTIGWYPAVTRTILGTLAGVPGTLSASTASMSFTRTTDGSAVPVAGAVPFVPADGGREWDLLIVGLGRNDVSQGVVGGDGTVRAHVVESTKKIVASMAAQRKRFLLWGVTTATDETTGTSKHTTITGINADLAALYPNNFIDIRSYLVHSAIYALGLTPTTADNTAMAGDTVPPQIMFDTIHFIKSVHPLIAAQFHQALTRREWTV